MSYRIHGVTVSDATRREFNRNKSNLREEGIKSAYSLQKYKNELTKIKKAERKAIREAVRTAAERDQERLEAMGYTVEDFVEIQNQMFKYNEKIEALKKTGKLSLSTGGYAMPIDVRTGKIVISRLQKIVQKMGRTPKQVSDKQRETFFNNVGNVFGEETERDAREELKDVALGIIYAQCMQYEVLSYLVRYEYEEFDEEAQEIYWGDMEQYKPFFYQLMEDMKDDARRSWR